MAPEDRTRLDLIEGVGRGYRLERVEVHVRSHEALTAWVYIAQGPYIDPEVVPFEWYHHFVLVGALQHALPDSYIDALRRVPTATDPDPLRARREASVLVPDPE
jgi:hypothetical protein